MDDVKINWYRTKIDGATMKQLTTRSNARGTAQALGMLLLIGASGTFTWYAWNFLLWPWIFVGFFLHGTLMGFATPAAAAHELCHGTAFQSRRLNDVFLAIFSFFSWTNPVHFWTSHKRHHLYTIHSPWDREVVLPAGRWGLKNYLSLATVSIPLVRMMVGMHFRHLRGRLAPGWEQTIFPESDLDNRRALIRWARVQVWGHLALALFFLAIGQWILILIVITPFYFPLFSWLCAGPQHIGLQSRVPDFRMCCRTMLLNPVLRFLYWHMNYHTEHHMFPGIPFYNLGKVHQLGTADGGPQPCKGLIGAWREIHMIQRKQAEQPGIAFDSFSRGGEPAFVPQEGNGPRAAATA